MAVIHFSYSDPSTIPTLVPPHVTARPHLLPQGMNDFLCRYCGWFPRFGVKKEKPPAFPKIGPFRPTKQLIFTPRFSFFRRLLDVKRRPLCPLFPWRLVQPRVSLRLFFKSHLQAFPRWENFGKREKAWGKKVSRGLNGHAPACNRVAGESFNYTLGSGGRYSFPLPCLPFSLGKEECLFPSASPRRPDCRND